MLSGLISLWDSQLTIGGTPNDIPMYETHLVHRFNGENALRNVEPGNILRERIVLNEHRHQVAAW